MNTNLRSHSKYQTVNINSDNVSDWPPKDDFRFVEKSGRINVDYTSATRLSNMQSNAILFIMQASWNYVLGFVLFSFIFSWFFFAALYFLISIEHGDFVFNKAFKNNQTNSEEQVLETTSEKCVKDVHDFLSALLFSIETQHTIGYGSRYITTECMGGILVLTLQSSLGYLLQVIVTQIVFSKLSRPTGKSQFIVFSQHALIAPRNNLLTLTFRIGNLSASQLISASVRLIMIRQRQTREGEVIPHQIYDMQLTHVRNGQLFFPRPIVIEHIIDAQSPLYGIQPSTLTQEYFEIIAIIEGAFDHTGFSCHFRTSYVPKELLWGYRFSSCDSTLSEFDYRKFDHTQLIHASTPWNYEEELTSNSPSPPTPTNASFFHSNIEEVTTNHDEHFQSQSSTKGPFRTRRQLKRLSTIDSLPNDTFAPMVVMDSKQIEDDEEEDKLTFK